LAAVTDSNRSDDDETDRSPFYFAGLRAREEMLTINRLADLLQLAAFRSYLAAAVTSMSAPVPDVLAMIDSDLPSALRRVRPTRAWPSCAGFDKKPMPLPNHRQRSRRSGLRPGRSRTDVYALPLRVGDAIIRDGGLTEWVEVAVAGMSMDIAIRVGSFELSTAAGMARIILPAGLPDTVIAACVGYRVDRVIDHPLLNGRRYVVTSAFQTDDEVTIEFDVGLIPITTPWNE
jgi:hypothetical protein